MTLFRVVSPSRGSFLLRLYEPTQPPEGNERGRNFALRLLRYREPLRSQAIWLSYLRESARLPVPEPIPTSDGEFVDSVEEAGESRHFLLLRWIPGEQRRYTELSQREVSYFGSCIAKLHVGAESFSAPEGFVRPRWNWGAVFDETAPYWSLAEVLLSEYELRAVRSAGERIRDSLNGLGESRKEFGIIHRDMHLGNAVFHEGVLYTIDFDHCGWGYYLDDLAMPYLDAERFGDRCARTREALLQGYASRRHISEEHLETFVHLHVMNRLIRSLGRLQSVRLREIPANPVWSSGALQGAVERLARFARDGAG